MIRYVHLNLRSPPSTQVNEVDVVDGEKAILNSLFFLEVVDCGTFNTKLIGILAVRVYSVITLWLLEYIYFFLYQVECL